MMLGASLKRKTAAALAVCLIVFTVFPMAGCSEKEKPVPEAADCGIIHEPEFGGVYITKTIDEFNDLGFKYGDSVTVTFSNGYTLEDIPYYNGYYTRNGEPLLIAYPGYDYVKAAINNGNDLWETAELDEGDTATVTLFEAAKYFDVQNARDINYRDAREEFPSDEVFANFRSFRTGSLKEGLFYRSASPCDDQHKRAAYADALAADEGINYILNLADTEEKIAGYVSKDTFNSPHFLSLYEQGKVKLLGLNMNVASQEFKTKIKDGLIDMMRHDGPYLIHCTEGKDRTGFVCLLIEALCGATYDEIVDDYMITYDNYYKINEENDKERYDAIVENVLDPLIESMTGDPEADIHTADLSAYAEAFLMDAGMTEKEITELKGCICGINVKMWLNAFQ